MYKYDEAYKIVIENAYKNLNRIADANDTSFEYVIRDLYNYHFNDAWR
jgi:hypothetical protein